MGRRSVRRRKKRGSSSSSSGGQGLTTVSLITIIFFILILAAALFIVQYDMVGRLAKQQALVTQHNAQQSAERLSKVTNSYLHRMAGIATEPAIARLIQSGDKTAIAAREQQLKSLFPSALAVRLLPAGLKNVDREIKPHLSFACLDMLHSAEDSSRAPMIELHAYGTEQQHIDFVEPVMAQQQVVGHLQVVMDVKLIQQWVEQAVNDNYLELTQRISDKKDLLMAKAGEAQYRDGISSSIEVEGTRWIIRVWTPAVVSMSLVSPLLLGVLVVASLLAVIVVFLLRRSVSNAIASDLENYTQLAIHVIRGDKSHDYSVKMSEFKDAVVRLHNIPMNNSMERERDHDPGSISMGGGDEMSSLYISESSMTIEELDDIGGMPEGDEHEKKS